MELRADPVYWTGYDNVFRYVGDDPEFSGQLCRRIGYGSFTYCVEFYGGELKIYSNTDFTDDIWDGWYGKDG